MSENFSKENKTTLSEFHKKFEEHLSRLRLRQTKQRKIILDTIFSMDKHVDAEKIYLEVKKSDPTVGLATIYRTLKMLTDAQILDERRFTDRSCFELASTTDDDHHDHLICNQCGAIVEFYDKELENSKHRIAHELGFQLKNHKLELFADCLNPSQCQRIKDV